MEFQTLWNCRQVLKKIYTKEEVQSLIIQIVESNSKEENLDLLLAHYMMKKKFGKQAYLKQIHQIIGNSIEITKTKKKKEIIKYKNAKEETLNITNLLNYIILFLPPDDINQCVIVSTNWVVPCVMSLESSYQYMHTTRIDESHFDFFKRKNKEFKIRRLFVDGTDVQEIERVLNVSNFLNVTILILDYFQIKEILEVLKSQIRYHCLRILNIDYDKDEINKLSQVANEIKTNDLKEIEINDMILCNEFIKRNITLKTFHFTQKVNKKSKETPIHCKGNLKTQHVIVSLDANFYVMQPISYDKETLTHITFKNLKYLEILDIVHYKILKGILETLQNLLQLYAFTIEKLLMNIKLWNRIASNSPNFVQIFAENGIMHKVIKIMSKLKSNFRCEVIFGYECGSLSHQLSKLLDLTPMSFVEYYGRDENNEVFDITEFGNTCIACSKDFKLCHFALSNSVYEHRKIGIRDLHLINGKWNCNKNHQDIEEEYSEF